MDKPWKIFIFLGEACELKYLLKDKRRKDYVCIYFRDRVNLLPLECLMKAETFLSAADERSLRCLRWYAFIQQNLSRLQFLHMFWHSQIFSLNSGE